MSSNTPSEIDRDYVIVSLLNRDNGAPNNLILDPETAVVSPDPEASTGVYRFEHRPEGGDVVSIEAPRELVEQGVLEAPCPVCECQFLYRQRDFNRGLGMGIVGFAAFVGVVWAYLQGTIFPLVGCLMAATLIDGFIFARIPEVFVCYKCLTCFRRIKQADEIKPFDLEIGDGFTFQNKED